MSRRGFLKYNARLLLWTAAISAGLRLPRPAAAGEIPDIALAVGDRVPATRAAVDLLGGMGRFVKPGQKVVIKPNMSFAGGPEDATDTNPEVVRELVAMCREAGAERVRVLDHTLRREERCIEGVQKACEVHGDDIVQAVSRSRFFKETPIPEGRQMTETDVMREVLEADVLIAAPVAKSHSGAGVSLSMKGMMGLVYNRGVMHSRYDLHESIVDLASLLKPALVVVDGSRVLSTNGPGGPGRVLKTDTIIASTDMVAADAQAVSMFEWYGRKLQPRNVKHIRIAHERGLGRMDVENLRLKQVQV
ncbi:MAG: DUF362 domain-containing protein [Desulfobacteraceae bacterium]|nr:DUF362 domain-containing protein [Desulfobacteraceae bacterium]MBC2749076.1 DUF362 domain-containing protein [Desulfobacteraceae bacterium]